MAGYGELMIRFPMNRSATAPTPPLDYNGSVQHPILLVRAARIAPERLGGSPALLEAARGDRLEAIYVLAITAGLRGRAAGIKAGGRRPRGRDALGASGTHRPLYPHVLGKFRT